VKARAKKRKNALAKRKQKRKKEKPAKPPPSPTRQKINAAAREYVPMVLGIRIPGFLKVHWRYAKRSFITWFVLFIAPFVIGVIILKTIAEKLLELHPNDVQLFLIALFLIALAFFFAERHRRFRHIYVRAIPAMVILNGLFNLFFTDGLSTGGIITFAVLAGLPAWWLGRRAMGKGYKLLSDGACKDYRPGRDLYMDGHYEKAFAHLEPSAKRGQMKALYLLGHAHEHGNGRPRDRIKAARFYDKSSRKGYGKAHLAYDDLFDTFSKDEITAFETDLGTSGINELF
jgi:hypothetical protein